MEGTDSLAPAIAYSLPPTTRGALKYLAQLETEGRIDVGEMSDLADTINALGNHHVAQRFVDLYVTYKEGYPDMAPRLFGKKPWEIQYELDNFEIVRQKGISALRMMRTLFPSEAKHLFRVTTYVRETMRELLGASIIRPKHGTQILNMEPRLAEIRLRTSLSQNGEELHVSNSDHAMTIQKNVLSWLEPSGWPESEIERAKNS